MECLLNTWRIMAQGIEQELERAICNAVIPFVTSSAPETAE